MNRSWKRRERDARSCESDARSCERCDSIGKRGVSVIVSFPPRAQTSIANKHYGVKFTPHVVIGDVRIFVRCGELKSVEIPKACINALLPP